MIVHLAASLRDPKADADYLRQIIEVIHDQGGVLSLSWLEPALARAREGLYVADWKPYVDANLEGVRRADVVIADLTHYSFSQGFLIAAAFEHNKPVLAVSRESLKGVLASGITDTLFTLQHYSSKEELTHITRAFLQRNTVHTKDLRFNMFLTRSTLKYLEDTSRETGKNRSEIIRELIKQKLKKGRGDD